MRLRWIAAGLAAVGAGLVVAGILIGPDTSWFGIQGAYFTRAAGAPAYEGTQTAWADEPQLLSLHDGNLWLGAGIACCAFALGLLVAGRVARRRDAA